LQKKDNIIGFYFLIPALILLSILIIYPLINAVYLSFCSQLIYELKGRFIGLANYIEILQSKEFWDALLLSFIWTVSSVSAQVLLGVSAALLLNENFKGRGLVRALVLLPFFVPTIATVMMWRWVLDLNYGVFNYLLMSFNIINKSVNWLGNPNLAMFTVINIAIWRFTPFVIINVLARLQIIPPELYEAAEIDGASKWSQFRYITLPELKGVLLVVILLRVIFMFKKLDIILILTGGGPGSSTRTLPVFVFTSTFQALRLGEGAANAILTFLITLTFVLFYTKATVKYNKEVE